MQGIAPIMKLLPAMIKPPSKSELKTTMTSNYTVTGLPYIAGFINGTTVILKYKPADGPQDYWCRKGYLILVGLGNFMGSN